jgi:hypothetical protein
LINMKITGLDELKKLSKDIKNFRQEVNQEGQWVINTLYKNITVIFERSIDDLVYEQYDPEGYQRTYHLMGGHGAIDEEFERAGQHKRYKFSIDEDSRDPVDGTTWGEKAYAIEHGATEMGFKKGTMPFNRPFIKETQETLEWENKRTADQYERSVYKLLNKIAKG